MMAEESRQEVYDVIVIGAGIVGSSTAYYLAKHNNNTLLLEQFPLPHSRGSSHGQSRIIRKAYTEDHYAVMMGEAYERWAQLEKETNTQLYQKCGLLVTGPGASEGVENTKKALEKINVPYNNLTPVQLKTQYPQLKFGPDHVGIFDPEAGILRADKCLNAMQRMFKEYGGTLRDGTQVQRIIPGEIVTVDTCCGPFRARSLVISAGPWASRLIQPLGINIPLKPVRISVCYWPEKRPGHYGADSNFPCLISYGGAHCYALPSIEYKNHAKVCLHSGPEVNPDRRDADTETKWDLDMVTKFVTDHCPGLENKPSIVEKCLYTVTPDEDFVIDTHPHWKNIVIGAGFSGHGFKMAPVTGRILGEMATGRQPAYDIKPFSINRFTNKAKL